MAEPFATVADLEARWRPLTEDEQTRAEILLTEASAWIRNQYPAIDKRITDGKLDPVIPQGIVCTMVERRMITPTDQPPVTAQSSTIGPFATSYTYANATGSWWLSRDEKAQLRGKGGRAFMINTTPKSVHSGDFLS